MRINKKTEKIIVLRFSSMGDVAIVASFLKEFREKYPDAELIMVSKKTFKPFFESLTHVAFHALEANTKHKGVRGLYRLFKELKKYKPTAVADLHDNIRSHIVSFFFRMSGIKIERIDKGRKEKKELTRQENKILKPLKQTIERYADVFRQLGFSITLKHKLHKDLQPLPQEAEPLFDNDKKKIGISPFAQYSYKVYDLNKMGTVIKMLSEKGYEIFVFGGTKEEKATAGIWEKSYANVHDMIHQYNLSEELAIISSLDVMLSMDSSGMHLASLVGVPVVSVWGPTHPYAGFPGYGQSLDDCLQVDDPARPTSVYGNKPCLCGDTPCIDLIAPEQIVRAIDKKLSGANK